MRFIWFFLLCISLSTSCFCQKYSKSQTDKKIWQYLEKYSPSSFQMMKTLYDLPQGFTIQGVSINLSKESEPNFWVNNKTDKGIVNALNTVVHESMHGLTSRYPYKFLEERRNEDYNIKDDYSAFYISAEEIYIIKHTEIFNSHRIAKNVPKDLKTFRFSPYISPRKNNLGSQADGIFGLMDEWNAYYHGTKAAYDLFDFYREQSEGNQAIYLEYVNNMAGTYYAYYEFKYFILKYLELAKQEEPEIYHSLMTNKTLRKAYTAINNAYANLIEQFEAQLDDITIIAQKADETTRVYKDQGYFFINGTGVGLFTEEADLLKKELSKKYLRELDEAFQIN